MNTSQYEGNLERWDGRRISGWLYSKSDPNATLRLDIVLNGLRIETISAGNYREDLYRANKGSGKHAFESGDLSSHLKMDSSLEVIQIFLSQTDIWILKPIFLRNDKKITPCFFPWTTLYVRTNGDVYPCICPAWIKDGTGVVGNEKHESLNEIWNASPIQQIRKDFIKGNYSICRLDICPYAKGEFQQMSLSRSVISAIIRPEETFNTGVEQLVHEVDQGCNLTCVMCRKKKSKIDSIAVRRAANDIEMMAKKGDLKQLRVAPAGEALLQQDIVRLLKSRTLSDNGVHITIFTNLTSITPVLWNAIKHNDITILASLDGATKQTYEKIRIGARWDFVYRNLLFLIDAYKKGELCHLGVSSVVMGINRNDLGGIIELTKNLGVDLYFIKHEGFSTLEENVFDCCKLDILDEIYEEIEQHHGFELPHVHLGSAGILINRYYRSLNYRMLCAQMQFSRYKRYDIAARIVQECMGDIRSGALEINQDSLSQYADFIEETRHKARQVGRALCCHDATVREAEPQGDSFSFLNGLAKSLKRLIRSMVKNEVTDIKN